MSRHILSVVGVGASGPASLTEAIQKLVAAAPVLAGSRDQLAGWPDHPRRIVLTGSDLEAFFTEIAAALADSPVVLLATGDPLFFGIGRRVLAQFGRERVQFYPNLSAVQLACSRAKLPWQQAVVVSVHGRSLVALADALRSTPALVAVLTDPTHTPAGIARLLRDLAPVVPYRLWVCARLGAADEQVLCLDPAEAEGRAFAEPNIVLLERQEATIPDRLPVLGIADRHFLTYPDRPGMITKFEVRALALAYLQLALGQICWDIGSGTGSVAIEMARLVGNGHVWAIEKSEAGTDLIARNCERLGITNLQVISGRAPAVLAALPDPERIFVGGGGAELAAILAHCAERLKPGGILVAGFAALDQLVAARAQLRALGWPVQYSQISLARSAELAESGTRLVPLNPVFLLRAEYPS